MPSNNLVTATSWLNNCALNHVAQHFINHLLLNEKASFPVKNEHYALLLACFNRYYNTKLNYQILGRLFKEVYQHPIDRELILSPVLRLYYKSYLLQEKPNASNLYVIFISMLRAYLNNQTHFAGLEVNIFESNKAYFVSQKALYAAESNQKLSIEDFMQLHDKEYENHWKAKGYAFYAELLGNLHLAKEISPEELQALAASFAIEFVDLTYRTDPSTLSANAASLRMKLENGHWWREVESEATAKKINANYPDTDQLNRATCQLKAILNYTDFQTIEDQLRRHVVTSVQHLINSPKYPVEHQVNPYQQNIASTQKSEAFRKKPIQHAVSTNAFAERLINSIDFIKACRLSLANDAKDIDIIRAIRQEFRRLDAMSETCLSALKANPVLTIEILVAADEIYSQLKDLMRSLPPDYFTHQVKILEKHYVTYSLSIEAIENLLKELEVKCGRFFELAKLDNVNSPKNAAIIVRRVIHDSTYRQGFIQLINSYYAAYAQQPAQGALFLGKVIGSIQANHNSVKMFLRNKEIIKLSTATTIINLTAKHPQLAKQLAQDICRSREITFTRNIFKKWWFRLTSRVPEDFADKFAPEDLFLLLNKHPEVLPIFFKSKIMSAYFVKQLLFTKQWEEFLKKNHYLVIGPLWESVNIEPASIAKSINKDSSFGNAFNFLYGSEIQLRSDSLRDFLKILAQDTLGFAALGIKPSSDISDIKSNHQNDIAQDYFIYHQHNIRQDKLSAFTEALSSLSKEALNDLLNDYWDKECFWKLLLHSNDLVKFFIVNKEARELFSIRLNIPLDRDFDKESFHSADRFYAYIKHYNPALSQKLFDAFTSTFQELDKEAAPCLEAVQPSSRRLFDTPTQKKFTNNIAKNARGDNSISSFNIHQDAVKPPPKSTEFEHNPIPSPNI